jgi:hypothetical protein
MMANERALAEIGGQQWTVKNDAAAGLFLPDTVKARAGEAQGKSAAAQVQKWSQIILAVRARAVKMGAEKRNPRRGNAEGGRRKKPLPGQYVPFPPALQMISARRGREPLRMSRIHATVRRRRPIRNQRGCVA